MTENFQLRPEFTILHLNELCDNGMDNRNKLSAI